MEIDVIILSYGKTQPLIELTQRTIDTCHASEDSIKFNVLVIEQEPNVVYANCKNMHVSESFNYNKFMNIGLGITTNKYVALCNNDLVFGKGWASELTASMNVLDILSGSPYCPKSFNNTIYKALDFDATIGTNLHHHIAGWCIMLDRDILKVIGKLDEDFPFWFADNAFSEQLKANGLQHVRANRSIVSHLGSTTLNTMPNKDELTTGLIEKFIAKYPDNESAKHFKKHYKL
jgi:GT2 family glycosyltransferase